MRLHLIISVSCLLVKITITPVSALTPEELLSGIDAATSQADPFRKALNDPDPARSRAAVELMLASGDVKLLRMAADFAIRSPDPILQRLGVEAILSTRVPITSVVDGSSSEEIQKFADVFNRRQEGAVEPSGIGYTLVRVGDFNTKGGCFFGVGSRDDKCTVQVNADGIVITDNYLEGRFGYGEDGVMAGAVRLTEWNIPLAAFLRIIE